MNVTSIAFLRTHVEGSLANNQYFPDDNEVIILETFNSSNTFLMDCENKDSFGKSL